MRIALVILQADPARGGAERYTADLAVALAARGHDVSLLASSFGAGQVPASGTSPQPDVAQRVQGSGARVQGAASRVQEKRAEVAAASPTLSAPLEAEEQPDPPGGRPPIQQVCLDAQAATRSGRYLRFLDSLDAHLSVVRPRYDVVHAMLPVRRCDVYHPHAGLAVEAVQNGHLKHATAVRRALARWANRLNRRRRLFAAVEWDLLTGSRPPVVLCLSDYIKQMVRRHYPLGEAHLARLFNAVDLHRFDPAARPEAGPALRQRLGINPDKVVALMIAQDYERKGLRQAIAAMARVRDPRLVLVVVGKQDPSRYRREAARQGLADRVVFAGASDDPAAFYLAADFLILPTRHDPCSLVVLEALAMGLPVISTRFNGACEIMADGKHGAVLGDPDDIESLSEAVRRLLDPELRQRSRQACLQLRPSLSQQEHVERLLAIYRGR